LAAVDETEAQAAHAQASQALEKTKRDLERVQHLLLGQGAVGKAALSGVTVSDLDRVVASYPRANCWRW
jgi:tartrate dehydratase alpha subunit/fumarate hydratase class I-like protein